jgi:serine/threonine protein kinase
MSTSSPKPPMAAGAPKKPALKETAAAPVAKQPASEPQKNGPEESGGAKVEVPDQLKPGRLFASFELQRELEIGSTGTVWLAQDYGVKRHADQVALKFLPELIVNDKSALEDLQNQIRRRIPLQHPNILRVYDLAQNKERVAVQMEYLDGQSLSQLRLTKPNQVFEVRDLEKWTKELCHALEYAQRDAGLANGNIVPGNLIVDPAGNLKVKDFGLTNCIVDSMSRLLAMDDPCEKLPPESLAAGEEPTITDDLYSLGTLLYELLTSKPPFDGDMGAQADGKLPSMSQRRAELGIVGEAIPKNWEETVAACLAKDPLSRPQSASEVEKRLENASVPIPVPDPKPPVRTWSIRQRWLTGAGLVLILALGSAVAFFALHRLTEPKRVNPVKELAPTIPSVPSASTGKESFLSAVRPPPLVRPTPSLAVDPATSPEVQPSPSPTVGAATSHEVRPASSPEVAPATSPEVRPAPSPVANSITAPEVSPISPREIATPNTGQPAGPSPASLSQNDTDSTKEDVINRINAIPGVTAEKKANLIEKMHKARSMERLTVIPFDASQGTLRRAAVDELLKAFSTAEMRDKLSDPTTILVVAGYADTGGRADLNLRISQERAENVSRILKEQAKLPNAMQTIGMGGTLLLDNKRPNQNRAVEVWAVVPF